jgi:hypothetical protein
MRMHLTTATAGLLLLAGVGAAAAQDVVIQPEQETVIQEYVHKQPLASVQLPGVELNVGSTLPDTVDCVKSPTSNTAMSSLTTRPSWLIQANARS